MGAAVDLPPEAWANLLGAFARATGVSLALYDEAGALRAGPFVSTPLGQALEEANAFAAGGFAAPALEASRGGADQTPCAVVDLGHGLRAFGCPLRHEEQTVGIVVGGWVFSTFPEPRQADRLAASLGMPYLRVWQVARQQPPVHDERLALYAQLLRTSAEAALVAHAQVRREQERSRRLALLHDAATRLAAETNVGGVAALAVASARALGGGCGAALVVREGGAARIVAADGASNETSVHRYPLPGDAALEVGASAEPGSLPELTALVALVGAALEKAHLIADLERQRESLEQAGRLRDEFVATVSHELRTPLNAILGWAAMLRGGQLAGPAQTRAVEVIERNARTQAKLIDDLLDLSRMITGSLRLSPEAVDVARVAEAVLEGLAPAAQAKRLHLHMHTGVALPVYGDAARLQQVVWNLLANAVKFTPAGGTVEVRGHTDSAQARVVLEVHDSGPGIPREFLPHVFSRFRQADGSITRTHGGLGLGLAIARHIVELHGGEITVRSPGELGGASFAVTLPRGAVSAPSLPSAVQAGRTAGDDIARAVAGLRVLVVDDDEDARDLARTVLEGAGARVSVAASGAEAFEQAARGSVDVLVADLAMPGEDGFSLLRRLLARDGDDAPPALALSAFARPSDRVRSLAAGFRLHLAKPVDPEELLASVASVARFAKRDAAGPPPA